MDRICKSWDVKWSSIHVLWVNKTRYIDATYASCTGITI